MDIPLFLVPILVGLIAQATKSVLNRDLRSGPEQLLPRYGGMPSAHTAFAFSLATTVAMADGIMTTTFAISAALVFLIIDDALRMRMFLGRYGAALHALITRLPKAQQSEFPHLEARLGHRPREVVAGAALGLALTLAIMATFGIV